MKRIGIILLQLLVTVAGIWYVFHNPHKRAEVIEALRHTDKFWLAIGWSFYGAVEALATLRWQLLLRIQKITLGWLRAFAIVMIGLFFNMFLGLIGGDAVRLYFVFKQAPGRKTRATLSVVMDRLLGLLSILFLAGFSVALRFSWLKQSGNALPVAYLALSLLGGRFAFVIFLFVAVGFGLLHKLPKGMPLREPIIQSGEALNICGAHYAAMMAAFAITVGAHLAYYLSYYCAARSLHPAAAHTPSLLDMLAIMPLVNTITALPISFGGVGVREALFQQLRSNLAHVPAAIAAFPASLGFAIQATWGIAGAIAYLVWQKIQRR